MRKKYKVGLIVIVVLIFLAIGIGVSSIFFKKEEVKIKNVTNIISDISDYGYSLDDRDTVYMKDVFKELEDVLNEDEINYNDYAEVLAKLFVSDFYTLNNKINKYDVGSLEYILNEKQEMFKTKAIDTIYGDIIDNTYKDRVQDLPEIKEVQVLDVVLDEITLNEVATECYKVTMEYTYKKDLGYDNEGTLYLVKNNNKLEVAIYKPEIEENLSE